MEAFFAGLTCFAFAGVAAGVVTAAGVTAGVAAGLVSSAITGPSNNTAAAMVNKYFFILVLLDIFIKISVPKNRASASFLSDLYGYAQKTGGDLHVFCLYKILEFILLKTGKGRNSWKIGRELKIILVDGSVCKLSDAILMCFSSVSTQKK